MRLEDVSAETIATVCSEAGIKFFGIKKRRDLVYRGNVRGANGDSATVYAKIYRPAKEAEIRAVLPIAEKVRLPNPRLIPSEDFLVLLMDEATGQALSRVLPLVFLPGIWSRQKDKIETAYEMLGASLGVLHSETERTKGPLLNTRSARRTIDRLDLISDYTTPEQRSVVRQNTTRAHEILAPYAITHTDPSPHNIFYDDGDISVIDINFSEKAAAHDHANVLMGIRLMLDDFHMPGKRSAKR